MGKVKHPFTQLHSKRDRRGGVVREREMREKKKRRQDG